jgi:aminopeptidase N
MRLSYLAAMTAAVISVVLPQGTAAPASGKSDPVHQYAPSREFDLLHLALDVTPDFRRRTITATATLRLKPIALPLPEVRLDAVDLTVTNLTASEPVRGWQVTADQIIVTFDPPVPTGREVTLVIAYRAQPAQGLFFRTPEMGYPAQDEHLWTQGEAISARHWYPGFDSPNEKFTTEITCRVPQGMVALSNGRMISEEKTGDLTAFRWLQDKPHANYLVTLVAGYFQALTNQTHRVPLTWWSVPTDAPFAASSFADTADMMTFFERETGVPYPWARYDQACVLDFTAGGMENTCLTVLNNSTFFTPATENLRNSQGLVAHELAHQWFGDLVTCKDWSHLWLNEGFATYYEHLYDERRHGRDEFLYRMWQSARSITGFLSDTRPVVYRGFADPDDMFDWRAYGKAGWVLHMLRCQLGPDLFRRVIRTYLERHQFGNVVTEDFSAVVEELSGRSFDQFFDQWLRQPGLPEIEADYTWDERTRLARVTVRQTQPSNDRPLFSVPLTIRFRGSSNTVDHRVRVQNRSEDFHFLLPSAPKAVRVDPDMALLARLTFRPPGDMLLAQLEDPRDVIGRLRAVEQLQSRKDHEAIEALRKALTNDAFHGVRIEASAALRAIHTEESLQALLEAPRQNDARVRRAVVSDLGRFHDPRVLERMLSLAVEEKNPDIAAEALQALPGWADPRVNQALLKAARSASFRNHGEASALRALRAQQDPALVEPLLDLLRQHRQDWTSLALTAGLDALGLLGRDHARRNAVLEFLLDCATDLRPPARQAAIRALGSLEDPRALAVLGKFASAHRENPERKAAEAAMEAIRAARKSPVELVELRKEVQDLQRLNRDLRKDLDSLQKRFEALPAPASKPATNAIAAAATQAPTNSSPAPAPR